MFGPISVENAEYFKLGLNSLWTGITKKDTKWQYGNDTEANLMDWARGQPSKTVSSQKSLSKVLDIDAPKMVE